LGLYAWLGVGRLWKLALFLIRSVNAEDTRVSTIAWFNAEGLLIVAIDPVSDVLASLMRVLIDGNVT
jgi:hypothetical protein